MNVLLFVPYLIPIVSGMIIGLIRGEWLTGIGAGVLLFVRTLSVTFNMREMGAGIGFIGGWIE